MKGLPVKPTLPTAVLVLCSSAAVYNAHAGPAEGARSVASSASGVAVKAEDAVKRGAKATGQAIEGGAKAAGSAVQRVARKVGLPGTAASAPGPTHGPSP
jgi:hypothetical protein